MNRQNLNLTITACSSQDEHDTMDEDDDKDSDDRNMIAELHKQLAEYNRQTAICRDAITSICIQNQMSFSS